ncbi:PepSY domain-containing protein [Thalassospira marina]|uniref:PepSY domain-containing protein n=1 Tax=Thalassospira marina TaxID=2048283 RepID=A0A2N3KS04_9PROT|nr:PepSY domain-containing protein [Thalassospira marina]PKR53290.1 hypothetical protein COO20_14400 [Thalassospira marina]
MKNRLLAAAMIMAAGFALNAPARADENICKAPMDQWQPRETLQHKLEGQGWQIRRIKTGEGCYEVYATDANGKKIEAYFDPHSLEPVKVQEG